MNSPCQDCKERTPGCHTRCPDGQEWDKQERAKRDKIKTEKARTAGWSEYKRDIVDKRARR